VSAAREAAATFHIGRQRLAGFRDALAAAGLDWAGVPIEERPNELRCGVDAGRTLLRRHPRPTAILASTDQLALGVLEAAAELGLRVPDDLSVAGFDDVPAAGPAGLTTIRQPLVAKGEAAARLLAELQAGGAPRRVMLPVELVLRGSTGPPPPGAA
jgi:DNA-binding LacI/PurR family transcriptional regulator